MQISYTEWISITPKDIPSGGRRLTGSWADLFSKQIKEFNPFCTFRFKYNRLKVKKTQKANAPFLKCFGTCKQKECTVAVSFIITAENEAAKVVNVTYQGTVKHPTTHPLLRFIRAPRREQLGKELEANTSSRLHPQHLANLPPQVFGSGKRDDVGSIGVLHKNII